MMVYLHTLGGEVPYELFAIIMLTGVLAAIIAAGITACRGIKQMLRDRDK